jgi:hypothetical protein
MAAPLATAAGGNAAALADAVVVLHFAYAAFVVGGFAAILLGRLLGWGWIRNLPFRIVHFAAMAFSRRGRAPRREPSSPGWRRGCSTTISRSGCSPPPTWR